MALIGAAVLIGFSLLAAFGSRLTTIGTTELPTALAVESRDLHFQDQADGSVAVTSPYSQRLIYIVEPGTGGFARGVLRGLSRDRKLRDIGPDAPFRITRWSDGRLSLSDPTTGVHIDLDPFGPDNIKAFVQMLKADEPELQISSN